MAAFRRRSTAFGRYTLAPSLFNKKVPVSLRLRLVDSIVTPLVIYSLSTTPLTTASLAQLNAVQRKMLRRIIGWVRYGHEEWGGTGQRMKARLHAALQLYDVHPWGASRQQSREPFLASLQFGSANLGRSACLYTRGNPLQSPDNVGLIERRID